MKIIRVALLLAIAASAVAAQGRGRGNWPPARVRVTYTAHDRYADSRQIVGWFHEHPREQWVVARTPHGRGHGLPPGWERRVARSRTVPIEYREFIRPAPVMLVQTLPPVRPGWEFVMLENRVLRVDRPT